MKLFSLATIVFLLMALILPVTAQVVKDDKKDEKADPAKKEDKPDAAKKDDKDAKADPAKKDDKDAAKKDDAKKDDAKKDDKGNLAKKDDPAKTTDKTTKKAKKDEIVNSQKSIQAGQITGKVITVEGTKRTLRLSVGIPVPRANPGSPATSVISNVNAAQALAQAQQASTQAQQLAAQAQQALTQAQQAASKKDMNGYRQNLTQAQNFQAQAAQAQAQAIQFQAQAAQQRNQGVASQVGQASMQIKYVEIIVNTTDEVKVRRNNPPEAFDDKGKPKRLTAKELKEAKGDDPKLPGYQADFSNLNEGQIVTAYLIKSKDQAKPKPAPKKDKDGDANLLGDNLPQASMIIIVSEPPEKR